MVQPAWQMGSHQGSAAVDLAHSILLRSADYRLKILESITVYRLIVL
ncbi:rCG53366, partial [Rattus norvegicus]